MSVASIVERVENLNVWQRGSERAPHKPLLLLLALGRWSNGLSPQLAYEEVAPELEKLLREFGPHRQSYHPEYPFWWLQNDRLWVVKSDEPLRPRKSNTNPPKSELITKHAVGELTNDVRQALKQDPSLAGMLAERLLTAHFPQTLHEDILSSVGLVTDRQIASRTKRDPQFRNRVLVAYEYRCAVCDLDIRLGNVTVGIEAAHIKWHQAGGADTEDNGFALCSTHHKIFDLGGYAVKPDRTVLVSDRANGSSELEYTLLRHHGQRVRSPQNPAYRPAAKNLCWHKREVFKGSPRHVVP